MVRIFFALFIPVYAVYVWGLTGSTWHSAIPLLVSFVVVPGMDLIFSRNKRNPTPNEQVTWSHPKRWAPFALGGSLCSFLVVAEGLYLAAPVDTFRFYLQAVTVGIFTGAFGIVLAHELMHRRERYAQICSEALLIAVCYSHFFVEHLYGHHVRVATPEDPATARRGETIYTFLPRTLYGSLKSALEIEKKLGRKVLRNRVLRGHLLSLSIAGALYAVGPRYALFFVLQGAVASLLLETVNYLEHYGLERRQLQSGRYESVRPIHSWNSSFIVSNFLLFNLERHSDHHANASLPYTVLKHSAEAPQLPLSYPAMVILAYFPPLWFRVMDKRLAAYDDAGI